VSLTQLLANHETGMSISEFQIHMQWIRLIMLQKIISSGWHHLIHPPISTMHLSATWRILDHGFSIAPSFWTGNKEITHSCGFMVSVSTTSGFSILNKQFCHSWFRKNSSLVSLLHFHLLPLNTFKVQPWFRPFKNRLTANLLPQLTSFVMFLTSTKEMQGVSFAH